jgi:hypothetical protein
MDEGRRGQEAVDHGQRRKGVESAPGLGNGGGDGQETILEVAVEDFEPPLEDVGLFGVSGTDTLDALADLADDEDA